jgi:hypothetical protein
MPVNQLQQLFYGRVYLRRFFEDTLPKIATKWSGDPELLNGVTYPDIDARLFLAFREAGYRKIDILDGLPNGDKGQTVRLFRRDEFLEPDLEVLTVTGTIPNIFMDSCSGWINGTYRRAKQDRRIMDIQEEQWFFGFHSSCWPRNFFQLQCSLEPFFWLSRARGYLNRFEVVLMNDGIYVLCSFQIPQPPCRGMRS